MSYERIYENIHNAIPAPKIEAALNDDPYQAGIITEQCPDALVASRLFNVATAGMDNLRRDPQAPLIERPVNLPEELDWIGRITLKLLNDSLIRPRYRGYKYESDYVEKLGICADTEEKFAEAVGYYGYNTEEPSQLFTDKSGNPVLIKKEAGQPSSLSLKAIAINNVKIPAATVFNLVETPNAPRELTANFEVLRADKESITSIAPLRFSAFTFKLEERPEILRAIEGFDLPSRDDEVAEGITLADIISFLPDQQTLRQAYSRLRLT